MTYPSLITSINPATFLRDKAQDLRARRDRYRESAAEDRENARRSDESADNLDRCVAEFEAAATALEANGGGDAS
jgi:hypothetical protein